MIYKMSKVEKYDHNTIQMINVETQDLGKIDPDSINFDRIRKTALVLRKYLEDDSKDPYTICVKARGAMNSISECVRVVTRISKYYKSQASRYQSIAILEKAEEWFQENKPNIKVTDGMRKTYANMDEDYLKMKSREDAAAALLEYLRNKRDDFEHDLNLAKKKMQEDRDEELKASYTNMADEEYEDVS